MGLKRRFFEQIDSWRPQKEATKGTENVLEILSDFGEAAAIASRTGRKRPPHEIHADLPLSGLKQKPAPDPDQRKPRELPSQHSPCIFSWCRGRFSARTHRSGCRGLAGRRVSQRCRIHISCSFGHADSAGSGPLQRPVQHRPNDDKRRYTQGFRNNCGRRDANARRHLCGQALNPKTCRDIERI